MRMRNATPEELAAGQESPVFESEPEDDWYTAEQVAGLGYKPEILEELFGEPTPGPGELIGWTVSSVLKIEQTVIAPAARLVTRIFADDDAASDLLRRTDHRI